MEFWDLREGWREVRVGVSEGVEGAGRLGIDQWVEDEQDELAVSGGDDRIVPVVVTDQRR